MLVMMSVKQKRRASCLLWTKDDKDETSASLTFDRDLFLFSFLSFLSFVSTNHDLMIPVTLSCHILSLFRGLASGIIPLIIISSPQVLCGMRFVCGCFWRNIISQGNQERERREWLERKETEVSSPEQIEETGQEMWEEFCSLEYSRQVCLDAFQPNSLLFPDCCSHLILMPRLTPNQNFVQFVIPSLPREWGLKRERERERERKWGKGRNQWRRNETNKRLKAKRRERTNECNKLLIPPSLSLLYP